MDINDAGYGIGGGAISAILVALGFKSRIDKLEKAVMYKDVFEQFEKRFDDAMKKMDEKIDILLKGRDKE